MRSKYVIRGWNGISRTAVRHFVADVLANLAKKSGNGSSIASKLRSAVSSGGEKGAGAALAIGNLDRSEVGSSSRSSLNEALRSFSDELKEAASIALMRVGDSDSAGNLAEVAIAAAGETNATSPKVRASIAALRALAALQSRNKDAIVCQRRSRRSDHGFRRFYCMLTRSEKY